MIRDESGPGAVSITAAIDTRGHNLKVKRLLGRAIRGAVALTGHELSRPRTGLPEDFDQPVVELIERVAPYTLTSPERIFALREAVTYLERSAVPGAIVECGVWKGGSMLAAVLTLQELNHTARDLYLYDTFEGMTPPGPQDVDYAGNTGDDLFGSGVDTQQILPAAPLDQVRTLLESTGYPADRLHFVQGDVTETIPAQVPAEIALLRLDTDWYSSTAHELEHLFPLIADGGVLMIDDYGHWQGARKAVDEYLARTGVKLLLHRIDYTGRMAVVHRAAAQ